MKPGDKVYFKNDNNYPTIHIPYLHNNDAVIDKNSKLDINVPALIVKDLQIDPKLSYTIERIEEPWVYLEEIKETPIRQENLYTIIDKKKIDFNKELDKIKT